MFRSTISGKRLIHLTEAFNTDGFEVVRTYTYNGRLGITAENKSILNYDTAKPKKAYYIEGTPYETGYLMGSMAEEEIAGMMDYTDRVVFSFIGSKVLEKIKIIQSSLTSIIYEISKKTWDRMPEMFREEVRGLYDGCKSRNPKTRVNTERLIVLNTGIDIICSMVYSGNFFRTGTEDLEPEDFDIPMMCNAFTVCGKSAGGGCYFGRDFTFPSSDVFQDTAALIVYSPIIPGQNDTGGTSDGEGSGLDGVTEDMSSAEHVLKGCGAIPFVNISAPGIIGSIAAMNLQGVAFGVNMSPGANCDPENIGVNSLLMTRFCAQYSTSAEDAAAIMARLPKGVSWLYIIADSNGRSCIAEAGTSWPESNLMHFPDEEYRPLLPDADFIRSNVSSSYQNGVMFRWNDYKYPRDYLTFNYQLWEHYNKSKKKQSIIYTGAFEEAGYINRVGDQNCPSSFYFAPQREESDELLVASNHCIIPEMRYFAMHHWTQRIVGKKVNDIQWRYDELNRQIQDCLAEKGRVGIGDARELISFLSPYGKYKGYYANNPRSRDGKEIRIEGCLSVFDLKNRTVESHYGYYCDKWIRLTLPSYF